MKKAPKTKPSKKNEGRGPATKNDHDSGFKSKIKGGGRAALSEETESMILELLMKRQGAWPFTEEENAGKTISEHKRAREQKRFLKRLVRNFEHQRLHRKYNNIQEASIINDALDADSIHLARASKSAQQQKHKLFTKETTSTTASPLASKSLGNIRLNAIEAVFPNVAAEAKKASSKKGGGKKSKSSRPFKMGTKKVLMVLPRTTSIPALLDQAHKKLRMKKKPVNAFVEEGSKLVNLFHDLAAINDGANVYFASQYLSSPLDNTTGDGESGEIGKADNAEEDDVDEEDSLKAVKQAYADRSLGNAKKRWRGSNTRTSHEHPKFSDHFSNLPKIPKGRAQLPAASSREDFLRAVENHRVVIVCGATGCGKSTQIPQFLWEGMQAAGCPEATSILVTQPRRVAATALAERVSEELGCPAPGASKSLVGHHVRLDRAVSSEAKIVYCTVGILLRRLVAHVNDTPLNKGDENCQSVPLSDLTHVVVDEVHERDVNTDFCLTLLRGALQKNPNLRLILMSATAAADLFASYFQRILAKDSNFKPGPAPVSGVLSNLQCVPILRIPGKTFPVQTKWLAECEALAGASLRNYSDSVDPDMIGEARRETGSSLLELSPRVSEKIDNAFITELVCAIVRENQSVETVVDGCAAVRTNGAILVFLPGKAEIEALFRVLTSNRLPVPMSQVQIHRLYSGMSKNSQKKVFQQVPLKHTKIILSTNLAETSLTISDVTHVVDTGRVKESRFNTNSRIRELVTVWTSQASSMQRTGRAGRTSPGVCYRLYSERFFDECLLAQTPPEILRSPLDELILQICLLYEQKRDLQSHDTLSSAFPNGANPIKLLSSTPQPPPLASTIRACKHLLEVDALEVIGDHSDNTYRLTPLGFHLSQLPMDAKVGKVLIVGCILQCLDGALTTAALLSSNKSCFFHKWGGAVDPAYKDAVGARALLVQEGFGGQNWNGGTVNGDLIAAIACYREWAKIKAGKGQSEFCFHHALDNAAMREIHELRSQYVDILMDAGFVRERAMKEQNHFQDDPLLTSCCLVAGLYPHLCTLMRPRKGAQKGGRLLTKDGNMCVPHSQSLQSERLRKAAESGKDAYAVYYQKHQSLGVGPSARQIYLNQVNFISRYAVLLFAGELQVNSNAIVVDEWLKFKIGDNGSHGPVLLFKLREELDKLLADQIASSTPVAEQVKLKHELLSLVRKILADA